MNIWIEVWMSIVGVLIPLAGIQQVRRLLERKTSKDISLVLYFTIVFVQLNWLWYGFYLSSICIIVSNIASLLISVVILFLCLFYRRRGLVLISSSPDEEYYAYEPDAQSFGYFLRWRCKFCNTFHKRYSEAVNCCKKKSNGVVKLRKML